MAPSRRFLTNFMVLSALAVLNIFVYVYFTHPALLTVKTSTHPTKIEVSRTQPTVNQGIAAVQNQSSHQMVPDLAINLEVKKPDIHIVNQNILPQGNVDLNPPVNQQQAANEDPNLPVNQPVEPIKTDKVEEPIKKIVLPHDYKLVINHPDKCFNPDGTRAEVFLLVLINSVHKNFEQRQAIRDTWGSPTMSSGKRIVTLFLLANVHDDNLQQLVLQEDNKHGDILMESFDDTYKNLTLKSIMGFKWVKNYCSHARFGMKTDDDMFVHYDNIVKFLIDAPDKKLAVGYLINGSPIRDVKSKWYMPRDLYPGNKYPPFLSGTGYVMSTDVMCDVYDVSLYTPYLYLEDVYVATCWDKIGVHPKKHPEFNNWKKMYQLCRYRRIMTAHMVTPNEMYRIWRDMAAKKHILCPR
ncbi:beta-1,3-galactosyltransferase 1-like [Glandiceps talaboti]